MHPRISTALVTPYRKLFEYMRICFIRIVHASCVDLVEYMYDCEWMTNCLDGRGSCVSTNQAMVAFFARSATQFLISAVGINNGFDVKVFIC